MVIAEKHKKSMYYALFQMMNRKISKFTSRDYSIAKKAVSEAMKSNNPMHDPDTAARFNITTPLRLAHFLAQCGHESGGFKAVNENLNYGAKGLRSIFAKYFTTDALALQYERKPEKIANRVYSSRMGNGDEVSGEGWKFRGRGYIQLTGKSNYASFDKTVDDDIIGNPDLVATKYPLASAAFFFNNNSLWTICDKGSDDATVTAVTKRVNGGTIGLADRIKHFKEYFALLK
jgi:putative chitinase